MKKRILPALLALCMVMSLLPTMAFAEDVGGDDDNPGGEDPVVVYEATKKEVTGHTSCKAVADWEQPENKLEVDYYTKEWEVGTNPHTQEGNKCGLTSGCTCGEIVTVTWTATVDGVEDPSKTKTETLYRFGEMCEKCLKNSTCNPCIGEKGCTAVIHDAKATQAGEGVQVGDYICPEKCYYDTKTGTVADPLHTGKQICADCAKVASKNPCTKDGCTLVEGHTAKHHLTTCTEDTRCNATSGHTSSCPLCCGKTENCGEGKTGLATCTLTYGHAGLHNNTECKKDARCGAAGKHTAKAEGEEGCPQFVKCGVGGCDKCAGHEGAHNAGKDDEGQDNPTKCLGSLGDSHCPGTTVTVKDENGDDTTTTIHIAGCPLYCACEDEGCTHKPGCPACAKEGVSCDCPVCQANPDVPASGAVTDNEGNEVDTTDPKEPTVPEVPVKAEDFTDIDAEDASQEWLVKAVQTMLDNGWMQGVGGSKFDAGTEANTGMVLTVVARMYGEDGIEGANYAELAKAWADENDLTEGIDLESDTIARKDIILLLWRLAGKSDSAQELEFTDVEGLEGDYLTALKWAVEKGIVMGNGDGTVTPNGILTRGQLAALVARYADNVK